MRFALALVLALAATAPNARAAGETFGLRWVEDRYCDEGAPLRRVGGAYLSILSDTQIDLCTDLFLCPVGSPAMLVTGTTTRVSRHRAVFVGTAPNNLVWTGPIAIEADLELGANGAIRAVHGTVIAPAVEGAYCAARGKFRTTKRTDP